MRSCANKTTDLDMHHVHFLVIISTFYNTMYINVSRIVHVVCDLVVYYPVLSVFSCASKTYQASKVITDLKHDLPDSPRKSRRLVGLVALEPFCCNCD